MHGCYVLILVRFEISQKQRGGKPRPEKQMMDFRDVLQGCALSDLGYRGPKFTWSSRRDGSGGISEWLDRFLGNCSWIYLFPQAVVTHGVAAHSDHLALWINIEEDGVDERKKKPFRFEAMWVGERKSA